jgi:hypothetical protein
MSKQKAEISAAAVTKAIEEGKLTSLTQVSQTLKLGKGSVSGAVSKRLETLVPGIKEMLAANKTAKGGGKPEGKKPASQDEGERLCPFRSTSKYAAVWLALWRSRKTGITRKALIEEVTTASKDFADPKTANFAVTVVTSPSEDGKAHRSASRAGDAYWVEKSEGGNLKLHLRSESKK